jgi:hypothetical protein
MNRYGSYTYGAYRYTYNRGMTLFGATINAMYSTAGPHVFKLTIRDATFDNLGVLNSVVSPDYNGTTDPTFTSTIIIDNVKVNGGSSPFNFGINPVFEGMKTINSFIRISNSTFTNLTGQVYAMTANAGPGVNANVKSFELYDTVLVENNLFRWNRQGTNGLFKEEYVYRQEYNNLYDRHVWIRDNRFLDNVGRLTYVQGNRYTTRGFESFTFEGNFVQNNTGTNDYLMYVTYRERITIIDNEFHDNLYYYGAYLNDYGGDQNGKKPDKFIISNNTFRNTYAGSTDYYNKGLFRLQWGGDVEFSYNNISGVEEAIINTYEYTWYSGYATLNFHHNNLFGNNGSAIYHYNSWEDHEQLTVWIEDNLMWDNPGMFTDYYDAYVEQYDYEATIFFRNNTVLRSSGTVLREYGKLIVTGNRFVDSKGYVIEIDYLSLNAPVIHSNVIQNCDDVYYIGAKDRGVLKMSITIKDLYVDCTGNAFYFKNVDITMENIEITQKTSMAIIVENSNVDAMSSTIPIGSGEVVGDGTINVWFEMEAFVEWANAENPDVSSGVRVAEALVVLYGSSGAYFTSEYTDDNGHLRAMRIPQWSLKGSFLSVWTPYTVSVAKNGVTSSMEMVLDKDFTGNDALQFLLVDTYIPVIRITSPFPGDLFADQNLSLYGFTTEVGSGVGAVKVAIGDGEYIEVEVDENGDFMFTFTDLPEGEDIELRAQVTDIALNLNETSVMITVDRTPPRLVVNYPYDGDVVNQQNILILGEYEAGATITINGLEREGPFTGTLSESYSLSEGLNTIVIEATDMAGNSAIVSRSVRLDRFAPTLTVLAPRDGLVTHVTNITVEGDVEAGSVITISVYRSETDLVNESVTPREDGVFNHKVDLEEGQNVIIVRSVDTADNVASVTRIIYLDTSAPMATITSPADGTITNENTIRVMGTAEVEGVTLYLNGKQIFNDGSVDRIVNLNEGENTIELRAVDKIGNEYRHRVTVTLDTTPPVIEMERPLADFLLTNIADLQVKGKVLGGVHELTIMGVSTSVDAEGGFDTTVTMPEEGVNDVFIVAKDRAGNTVTHAISVDYSTAKPLLSLVYQPTSSLIKGDDANFYIYGTTTPGIGDITIVHVVAGDTEETRAPVAEDGSFSVVRTLLDGTNSFTIRVTDAHGNTAESATYDVTYEYKAPKGTVAEPDAVDPASIGLLILVLSVALFATALVVTRSYKKD